MRRIPRPLQVVKHTHKLDAGLLLSLTQAEGIGRVVAHNLGCIAVNTPVRQRDTRAQARQFVVALDGCDTRWQIRRHRLPGIVKNTRQRHVQGAACLGVAFEKIGPGQKSQIAFTGCINEVVGFNTYLLAAREQARGCNTGSVAFDSVA